MGTRVVAIIQARLGSTRLPRKVLADLAGESMLTRVVNRTRRAKTVADVVVATTTTPADDAIADLCQEHSWSFSRGSEQDVLDRYYRAAVAFNADIIVRITSDCPLIEPEIIDNVVNRFLSAAKCDYASNCITRTYPRGLDTEVFSFPALKKAWQEATDTPAREHVTPYIWRQPEKFKICSVTNDIDYSHMRWTVDTVEDLELIKRIYEHFRNDSFSWKDVLHLLEQHPEWLEINREIKQKEL